MQAILSASSDLDSWIKRAALNMTNAFRLDHAEFDQTYDGTGYQLCYKIQWARIALPATLVLLSLTILIATMIKTARSPVPAWKGSPLAILFVQADGDLRSKATGHMKGFSSIEKQVGKVPATLRQDKDGSWFFRKA